MSINRRPGSRPSVRTSCRLRRLSTARICHENPHDAFSPWLSRASDCFCAIVFFIASADRLFSIRTDAVNVRLAAVVLLLAFAVFAVTRGRKSKRRHSGAGHRMASVPRDIRTCCGDLGSYLSGALKLGWFVFDFLVAFATIALFDVRDIARGYFCRTSSSHPSLQSTS